MNKVISVAAILALSAASNEFSDLEFAQMEPRALRPHRPTFSPLVHDIAHDDEQMIKLTPEILKPHYRTFTPLVADDNDDELLIRLDPQLTRPHYRTFTPLVADDNDDELVYATALRLDDNDDQYFVAPGLVADDEFYVDDEFFVDEQVDNELNFFKKIGNGLKKAGQFVVSHPQIITTAAKFLDDDEFYADQQADDEFLIRLDPALTRPHTRIPPPVMAADDNDDEFVYANALRADDNDDELYVDDEFFVEQADNELGFFKKIGDGLKKAGQFVVSHPQIITTAAKFLDDNDDEFYADDEFFVDEQVDDELFAQDAAFIKRAQRQVRAATENLQRAINEKKNVVQNSLAHLGGLLREGRRIQPKRPQPAKTQEVQDNMNFLEDFQDNNLSIKDKLKKAVDWVGDHPQVITEAAKTYKTLKGKH